MIFLNYVLQLFIENDFNLVNKENYGIKKSFF